MPLDGGQQPNLDQINDFARKLVLAQGQNVVQQIYASTFDPRNGNTLNIVPQNVGILKGFLLEITVTYNATGSGTATRTAFGPANILQQIQFNDLSNYTRINTTGWHIAMLNSAKRRRPYGIAQTLTSSPISYGNNYTGLIQSPATLAGPTTGTGNMFYYVPITYSDTDLRGMINMGVTNATAQLQLVVNANSFVASGDATLACYSGIAGNISSMTIKVYQHYIDQLPVGKNGAVIYPIKDASIMYMMLSSNMVGMVANQDFLFPYANFRDFLSTMLLWDNGGTLNAGTDVAYLALQTANFVKYYNVDPFVQALTQRNEIGVDFPSALYYFNHRGKMLSTQTFGNQALVLNASTVNASAVGYISWEMFGVVNAILGASSMPNG